MAAAPQEGHAASSCKEFCTEVRKVNLGFFNNAVWILLGLLRRRHIETMRGVIPAARSALSVGPTCSGLFKLGLERRDHGAACRAANTDRRRGVQRCIILLTTGDIDVIKKRGRPGL